MAFGIRRPRPPFEKRDVDTFAVNLPDPHREMIDGLLGQLQTLITEGSPALVRLFPTPYGDDEERNAGYAALAGSELVENRINGIDEVRSLVSAETLTATQMELWMRTLNDLRLVMGTILDVSDDSFDPPEGSDQDFFEVYELLGYLLECIVAALDPE